MGCYVLDHDRVCHSCANTWNASVGNNFALQPNHSLLTTLPGVLCFVAQVHAEQFDKARRPYVGHLLRVWHGVWAAGGTEEMQMAALLHDAVEDQPVTEEGLAALGVPAAVVRWVLLLTRREDVSPEDYYTAVAADPAARIIKVADVEDNSDPRRLALLPQLDRQRMAEKYATARRLLGMSPASVE